MVSRRVRHRLVGAVVAIMMVLVAVPAAMADDSEDGQEQIDHLRTQLERLEANTDDDVAPEEFETAFNWLREAEQFIEQGARRGVEQRVRRVDHKVDLLRALVDIRELERSIENQHQAYETSVEQVEQLEEEIEALEQRKQERQQELEQIREDL